jgi:hypothetical protein
MLKKTLNIIALIIFCQQQILADEPKDCSSSGGLAYVCGPVNAEDLVTVPHTKWILSSGMLPGGGIYLVDSVEKTWTQMYTGTANQMRHDAKTYGACQVAPKPESFISHGLNIKPGDDGHSTLYVVGHGGREAIEVFDVDANPTTPLLVWIGCIPMPEGFAANSVASFDDGSLVATVLMHPGYTFADVFSGKPTGAIYRWSPGDSGFELIRGTELPGNNGIEVSLDQREIYVVSTGLSTISVFSNSNPSRLLRATRTLDFGPDNIHMTEDGQLLTAGPSNDQHDCGELDPENIDIEEFANCPRGTVASTFDPRTMAETRVVNSPANSEFSNATMALKVGDEIWIGSFSGDRIGVAKKTD